MPLEIMGKSCMYQAGPAKIAEQANAEIPNPKDHITYAQSKEFIAKYFREARHLKAFIDNCNAEIGLNKFIYSAFGRKRRLREVDSPNKGVAGHALRSGVNFLVQSVASDINLLALVEAMEWIKQNGYGEEIVPFTIVHDSIVAEVKEELVPLWMETLKGFVQKDRGISIEGCPIEMDFEIGHNWGMLKTVESNISIDKIRQIMTETKSKFNEFVTHIAEDTDRVLNEIKVAEQIS